MQSVLMPVLIDGFDTISISRNLVSVITNDLYTNNERININISLISGTCMRNRWWPSGHKTNLASLLGKCHV